MVSIGRINLTPKSEMFISGWLMPFVAACGLVFLAKPILAQIAEPQLQLADFIVNNDLPVGIEIMNGYSRVFYEFDDQKVYISQENQNTAQASSRGQFITYQGEVNGVGQVFLYDAVADKRTQLSFISTNANPKVSRDGRVVWEGWIPAEDGWQVYYFDVTGVKQMTSGDLTLNADIEGQTIVYSRRNEGGTWFAKAYSLKENIESEITVGETARQISLVKGKVLLADGKEYPLTIEQLNILEKFGQALANEPSAADPEMIKEELLQGVIEQQEPVATESGEVVPEANPDNLINF